MIQKLIDDATGKTPPRKSDQDGLDACLCLLVALYLADRKDCLMVGDLRTGYIVVPYAAGLRAELDARCNQTRRAPSEWVRVFRLLTSAS
jgi:predicted RNase H-like nuclease